MKFLALILTYILCINAFAVGPIGVTGQNQSPAKFPSVIKAPNNQVTDLGASSVLVETGNQNLLANPSFEHSTFNTGWTCTGITPVVETTVVAPGSKKAMKLTPSAATFECYQDSSIGAAQAASVQFLAMIRAKAALTAGTLKVCARQAGVTSTTLCNSNIDDTFNFRKMPFTGSTTSNGISIAGTSATGTIYLDDAFVGAVDLKQDVDRSRWVGSLNYASTLNCIWTSAATSYANFTADTDCATPTVAGNVRAPSTKIPGFVLPAGSPAGEYVIVLRGAVTGNANYASVRMSDGTINTTAGSTFGSAAVYPSITFRLSEPTALAADTTVQVQAKSTASSLSIVADTTNISELTFDVYYYPSSAGSVYSSTNADTDWADCGITPSHSNWQGFGTPSAISLQCKRDRGELVMKGKFNPGVTTAAEGRIPLPIWNGTQLVTANTTKIPSIQIAIGTIVRSTAISAGNGGQAVVFAEPSVGYFTYGFLNPSNGGLTKLNANVFFTSGDVASFTIRLPIEGWDNSNVIIGQFNGLESCASTMSCIDTVSAKVSATGVVSDETFDWISGNASVASAIYTFTFNAGVFTVSPNCWINGNQSTGAIVGQAYNSSSTGVTAVTFASSTGAGTAGAFTLYCQRTGVDAVFKTARAVASDASIATPGITKMKACYFSFGGTSATAATPTECTTASCVEVEDTCNMVASAPVRNSAGDYTFTVANGIFAPNAIWQIDSTGYSASNQVRECHQYNDTVNRTWSANSSGGGGVRFWCGSVVGGALDGAIRIRIEGQAP
jgi:hypothetical protein